MGYGAEAASLLRIFGALGRQLTGGGGGARRQCGAVTLVGELG
jgi:hypothetical protein